jgi:hypothetical protein
MNRSSFAGTVVFAGVLLTVAFVRAGAPPGRYTTPATGTVYDTVTGLTWQQAVSSSTYVQAQAVSYCAGLSLNGSGWRLPTIQELLSIMDVTLYNPSIDPDYFPNTPPDPFWTSTPFTSASNYAWQVDFYAGNTDTFDMSLSDYARCVR